MYEESDLLTAQRRFQHVPAATIKATLDQIAKRQGKVWVVV